MVCIVILAVKNYCLVGNVTGCPLVYLILED